MRGRSFEGVLAGIPGLGGYLAGAQNDQMQSMGALSQAQAIQGLLSSAQQQQARRQAVEEQSMLRGVLQGAADPEDAVKRLMGAGSPAGLELAAKIRSLMPKVEDRVVSPGSSLVGPDGKVKYTAPEKPAKAEKSALARLIEERDALPEGDPRRSTYDNAIRKASETAKQISPTIVMPKDDKPPPGYRKTADGNLEAIPGGPADTKLQGALNQDTSMLQNTQANLDRLAQEANRLRNHPGLSKATGLMAAVPGIGGVATIPGTDAANFKAGLETLKSQVGFGVLQEMRNNSKTGGALGQVSDMENKLLQANLAAVDRAQSPAEFKAALGRIIDYTEKAKDRLRNAYNLKHKGKAETTSGAPKAGDVVDGYRFKGGNPADAKNWERQ